MADAKISSLPALSAPAAADLLSGVDTSDTTDAASGTNKKLSLDVLYGPAVRVKRTANQSITNQTETAIQFDAEDFDIGGPSHDTSTNNTRLTAPVDGLYAVTFNFQWNNFAAASPIEAYGIVRKNGSGAGTSAGPFEDAQSIQTSDDPALSASGLVSMVAGDYLELYAYHDSNTGAAALDVKFLAGRSPVFTWYWVRPIA